MMVIVGTYRADKDMMIDCLQSITDLVDGEDDLIFIDDSGDDAFRRWLADFGEVVNVHDTLGKRGFHRAMDATTRVMQRLEREGEEAVCWWEEDFTAIQPIDLEAYACDLTRKLCQVTFQRQPWFPIEQDIGLIAALEARTGKSVTRGPGETGRDLLWHQAQFSTNPGVWGPQAWRHGWPQCAGSEDEKTRYLVEDDDQWFALTPEVLVHHDGERTGSGY